MDSCIGGPILAGSRSTNESDCLLYAKGQSWVSHRGVPQLEMPDSPLAMQMFMHAVRSAEWYALPLEVGGRCSLLRTDRGRLPIATIGKRSAGGQEALASSTLSGWHSLCGKSYVVKFIDFCAAHLGGEARCASMDGAGRGRGRGWYYKQKYGRGGGGTHPSSSLGGLVCGWSKASLLHLQLCQRPMSWYMACVQEDLTARRRLTPKRRTAAHIVLALPRQHVPEAAMHSSMLPCSGWRASRIRHTMTLRVPGPFPASPLSWTEPNQTPTQRPLDVE